MRGRLSGLLALCVTIGLGSPVTARDVPVTDAAGLTRAIAVAEPGDAILLAPGDYRLERISVIRPGRADAPIRVTAREPGKTRVQFSGTELFRVGAPHWHFIGLDIEGAVNASHAFHVVGGADGFVLRGSRLRGFHAALKANPEGGEAPDDAVIEGNVFYNAAPRLTEKPVTPIDVVGGDRWVIRGNFIADFAKARGNRISYGAFLKGGGRNGIVERNLVICEWRHTGGARVGLSFGGGGSIPCTGGVCPLEHAGGIMRNNIVLNCPAAPGVDINRSQDISIRHNTIYRSWGVVARSPGTVATVRNNLMSGASGTRDGATLVGDGNIEAGFAISAYAPGAAARLKEQLDDPSLKDRLDRFAGWWSDSALGRNDAKLNEWFRDPGKADFRLKDGISAGKLAGDLKLPHPSHDFCGQARGAIVQVGAIDYGRGDCDVQGWLDRLLKRFP